MKANTNTGLTMALEQTNVSQILFHLLKRLGKLIARHSGEIGITVAFAEAAYIIVKGVY